MAPQRDGYSPTAVRRRRFVAAITIAIAALCLAAIPAATARMGRAPAAYAAAAAPSEVQGKGSALHAPKPQKAEDGAAHSEVAPKPAKHPKHPDEAVSAPARVTGTGAGSSQAPAGAQRGAGQHHQQGTGAGGAQRRHASERAGGGAQSGAPTHREGGRGASAQAKSGKAKGSAEPPLESERRRLREHAGKTQPTHLVRSKARQVEASHSSTVAGEGTKAGGEKPTSLATASAVSPAAAAAAPAAGQAQTGTVSPAVVSNRAQPAGHRKLSGPAHRHGAARGARGVLSAAAAGTPALDIGTSARPGPTGGAPPRSRRHGSGGGSSSPLARTITKIVGVVPTPIRILIAMLLALALAFGIRSRLTARRARRLERQRGQLLEDVGLLQAALLPVAPARLGPVGTTAAYRPADGPGAGGDFYDVFALADGQLGVIVGDISGHGRQALPQTALVRFTLRAYLEAGLSPRGALQTAGEVLERQLGSSFATVIVATYNPRERLLVYAGAGHPPPIVLGAGAAGTPLEAVTVSSAPPLGTGMRTGTRQTIVSVPGRAQICFHTDGLTEARVGTELFGPRRLADALAEIGDDGDATQLLDRVAEQADRRPDDMAACVLRVEGGPTPPRVLFEEIELDRESAASARTERFLRTCGVAPGEAAALMRAAAAAASDTGHVVLELRRVDGGARVTFQNDNLAYLQTRHAARQADRMVTL